MKSIFLRKYILKKTTEVNLTFYKDLVWGFINSILVIFHNNYAWFPLSFTLRHITSLLICLAILHKILKWCCATEIQRNLY